MRTFARIAILCLSLAACAQQRVSQPVSRIDPVKVGDDRMACTDIKAEIAQMDELQKVSMQTSTEKQQAMSGTKNTNSAASRGSQVAGLAAGVPALGFVGSAVRRANVGDLKANQEAWMQAQQDADDAKARKMHLVDVGNRHGCF